MRILCLVAGIAVLVPGCARKEEATQQNLLTNNSSGNPLTAPVDYLGAVNNARKGAIKTIDQTSLTKAIELFNAQEDRFPKDLNELAQKRYIQGVPAPPPGMKFDYNPQTGNVRVVAQ